ncbi:MAG: SusC/RagA family TonB-linked outer membrane protein, partial [Cyclobacteriaceae bacterium]
NRLNSESPNNINQWYYQLMMEPSEFQNQRFPDGTYGFSNRGENIWSMTDHQIMGKRESINDDLVLSTGLEVKFLKNFKYQFSYLANANQDMISANSPRYEIRDYWNENSTVSRRDINDYSEDRDLRIRTTMNSILSYENSWGDHSINVLAGYAEDYFKRTGVYALGRDFYNNEIRNLEQSDPEQRVIRNRFAEWGLRSYFGRASYAYKEKYFVEVNSRYDGSSRFPQGNKYGYFPSASAAWRLSEENFWGSISNVVSDFKLRYSYGITGNQEIGNYTHIPRLVVNNNYAIYNPATGNEEIVTGAGLNDLASTELSWETNTQHNLGIDMSFLDNKLTFSFDVFSRITDGILLDVPIPGVIGLNPAKTNAGVISNKGWESVLTYRGEYRDLKFSVSGNASFVADRIEDFGGLPKQFLFNNRYYREVGSSLYSLNGFIVEGFYRDQDDIDNFPARGNRAGLFPGDLRYRDVSGADGVPDGQINNSDMVDLGYGVPRYFFGLIADVEWKGFDLNMLWQGAAGHHVHLFGKLIESGGYGGWMPAFAAEGYWTGPEDVNARFPVVRQNPGNNIQSSDFWLEKGDYLRLKSLTIGYSLPESIVSRVGIERFRIYANAMNPLTFSRLYRHWQLDPEGRIGSLRYDYFPQVKSYNLGVMLTF